VSAETASALERNIECAPAAILTPRAAETGYWAERGNAIHGFVRHVAAGESVHSALSLLQNDDWRKTCEGIDFARLLGGVLRVRAEAAYRLDLANDTVTFHGLNIHRRYPPRPDAPLDMLVDGTNDWDGFRFDGAPIVGDLKTGRRVTACRFNPQMMFHARCQQLIHDADKVEARLVYVLDDGGVIIDAHTFTRFDLDTFSDTLITMKERIRRAFDQFVKDGTAEVNAGEHCRYCSAMISCPRYVKLARTLLPDVLDIDARMQAMTLDERTRAWVIVEEAEDLVAHVKEALKEMARKEPLPLPQGKILMQGKSSSTSFDRAGAIALLRAKGATDAEIKALTKSTPTFPVTVRNDPSVITAKPRRSRKQSAA
jgi:hypothetical protein